MSDYNMYLISEMLNVGNNDHENMGFCLDYYVCIYSTAHG